MKNMLAHFMMPESKVEVIMQLYEKLKAYGTSDAYPFHMPGHKRRLGAPEEVLGIDITEIDGFDNLHHAEGILKEAQDRAAGLYGSEDTYFLVNGSTAGILAAISACVHPGGKLLMARNSHKAAYHAAEVRGLKTVYLYPKKQSILPEDVYAALAADRGIEAVFVTSPTYEGVVSDIAEIAKIAHMFHVPLIVDEAHGAHFGFHPYFPQSSVKLGADLVIHSLHKTLPSLTQTALLHRNGVLVGRERIQKYLGIYQTSSPSYILMASMDACIGMLEREGTELFASFAGRLEQFYQQAGHLKNIWLWGNDRFFARDASKLVLCARNRTGKWLADNLRRRFHLELEMEAGGYAIALTSVADTDEGFQRLLAALWKLDKELEAEEKHALLPGFIAANKTKQVYTMAEADQRPHKKIPLMESEGEISAEYIYLYPPGIPLIVPGERISRELLAQLQQFCAAGLSLQGMEDHTCRVIRVVEE